MPQPVYVAGTPGNLIALAQLAAGKQIAAFLDASTIFEAQVTVELITGSSPPVASTAFNFYKAYADGSSSPITFTASAQVAATSLSVSGRAGLSVGQTVLLQQATVGKLGETARITAISGTSSPYTLTVSTGLTYSYAPSDNIYLMANTAVFSASPASSTGTWTANMDYAAYLPISTGQWVIQAINGDSTQIVTVNATYDQFQKIQ